MAKVLHTCSGCLPIDVSIIDAYIALIKTNDVASEAEEERVLAENARVAAETGRVEQFSSDHGVAVSDHNTANADHLAAAADHETAAADHGVATADHVASETATAAATAAAQSVGDATDRANAAAAAAEHMVDIHQGPPGVSPVVGGNGNWWTWDDATGQFVDTGEPARGEDGVGFQSISSQQDGTIVITLTDGNTVTIDLNHNHPQYPKYEYLEDESEMPATPDEDTLYLIAEESE